MRLPHVRQTALRLAAGSAFRGARFLAGFAGDKLLTSCVPGSRGNR